jgi:hypothetical protein
MAREVARIKLVIKKNGKFCMQTGCIRYNEVFEFLRSIYININILMDLTKKI